jgi:hypothetical protein
VEIDSDLYSAFGCQPHTLNISYPKANLDDINNQGENTPVSTKNSEWEFNTDDGLMADVESESGVIYVFVFAFINKVFAFFVLSF